MSLSRVTSWSASQTLTATALNGEFDNILNYLNAAITFPSTVTATAFIPNSATVPSNGMYLPGTNSLAWATNTLLAMTLDNLGALTLARGSFAASYNGSIFNGIGLTDTDSTVGNLFAVFRKADSTVIGSISRAGASSVAYNTTSDYRLKTDVSPMANASARVLAMNPVTFAWADGGEADEGFIAHELQQVVPRAVTGEKDAMDGDAPKYQAVDYAKVTPVLAAALKEVIARLDAAGIP